MTDRKISLSSQLDVLMKLAEEELLEGKDSGCSCEDSCDCNNKPELEGKEAKALSMLAEALRSKEASAAITYSDLMEYLRGL
jgi:hypothetical protein